MGTSAGSGGTGARTGTAVPAGAGGAATPVGAGGATGVGTPVTGEQITRSGEGSQMAAHTINVSGKKSDAPDVDNPEAEQFIADGKAKKAERIAKSRGVDPETVNKGQQGDVASGGKRAVNKKADTIG